ncbi:hypothetical protein [Bacteroides heparinolyticus]|uniref:hypothetical protein n=2 Tax=Prevotella heparinolytica TaxID=28113 RepID=UPI00359F4A42
MKMKKILFYLLLAAFCLSNAGCSKEDFYIDNNVSNEWNGEGTPTWLEDKQFEITMPWAHESFHPNILWKVYKFTHEDNLLVAISYEKVALDYISGIACYASNGRQVNFDKVEGSFKKNAKLICTNFIGEQGIIPQVCQYELNDCEKLQWLQEDINLLCKEIDATGNRFTLRISCGYCSDDVNKYIVLEHLCFDRTKKQSIKTAWFYTPAGQKLDTAPSIKSRNLKFIELGLGFFR